MDGLRELGSEEEPDHHSNESNPETDVTPVKPVQNQHLLT
jgi:hypothetical protein